MQTLSELRAQLSGATGDHDPQMTIILPAHAFDALVFSLTPQAKDVMVRFGGQEEVVVHGVSIRRDNS